MAEKLLLIDDDLDTLRLVGMMLQKQGYQIIAASNGQQGLDLALAETPDLILLDVMMPQLDGYEVARNLRGNKKTADIPILMFTAKSQLEDKVTGFEAGADDYLTKPVHPAELLVHVRALLSRSEKGKRNHVLGAFGIDLENNNGFLEVSKTIHIANDQTGGPDKLNYTRFSKAFAELICNPESATPITVGVFGEWGSGKSFLMGKIKEEALTQQKESKKPKINIHIIDFNAWVYSGSEHLWASLVTHLYRDIEKHFGWKAHWMRLGRAIRKSLPKALGVFAFYGVLGLGFSFLLSYNEIQDATNAFNLAVNAIAASLLGGSALASLPALWAALREFFDSLFLSRASKLQSLAARPDFSSQIGIMADIKDEIKFIRELLKSEKQGKSTRLVLFIDDLDRCEHRKAVEVLQAIMLLLADEDGSPFIIFLGLDARVIISAIEEFYGDVLVKAGINGYEYLDKIVQIPFVIPPAGQANIENYLDSLLWSLEEKKDIARKLLSKYQNPNSLLKSDIQRPKTEKSKPFDENLGKLDVTFTTSERKALLSCANEFIDNPRKIKRVINIYRLARLIFPTQENQEKVIRWVLITEQWPLHVAWITEYIERDAKSTHKYQNWTILDIYRLAKIDIHSESMKTLLEIDADPGLFEKFIQKNPIFTVNEIKDLLPFTFNLNPAIRSQVKKQAIKKSIEFDMLLTTIDEELATQK